MNTTPYDLEKLYDEQVSPLMAKILDICKQNNLPIVVLVQLQSDGEDEFLFSSSAVIPDEDRPISNELNRVWAIQSGIGGAAKLTITTKDKDGNTTAIEEIHS
jgi:hypothetical protein